MPFWVTRRSLSSGEPRREPAVQRHVGQHARAVEEAGLGGDEQERRLGSERDQDEGESAAVRPGWRSCVSNSTALRVLPFSGATRKSR